MGRLGFLLEFIFESIVEGYFALMQWIVPKRWIGQHFQTALKVIIGIFTGLLLVVMFLGFFALISEDADAKNLGRNMVYISLAISFVQISSGSFYGLSQEENNCYESVLFFFYCHTNFDRPVFVWPVSPSKKPVLVLHQSRLFPDTNG